jgi:hypothetical protein
LIKGYYKLRKLPKIEESNRGYHLIYFTEINDFRRICVLRRIIGDDKNRVRLDLLSTNKIKQVLFNKKYVKYYKKNWSLYGLIKLRSKMYSKTKYKIINLKVIK